EEEEKEEQEGVGEAGSRTAGEDVAGAEESVDPVAKADAEAAAGAADAATAGEPRLSAAGEEAQPSARGSIDSGEGDDEGKPSPAAAAADADAGTAPCLEPAAAADESRAGTATVSATADAEAEAAEAAAPAPAAAAPAAALPGARLQLSGPHLQLTSATSHDGMRPALARLEAESADAAISLLLACAAAAAPSSSPAGEACAQLERLCRQIIECSVAAHRNAAATAAQPPPAEPAAALGASLPGSSWDHAVRAAVLARAIQVVLRLGALEEDGGSSSSAAGGKAAARQLALLPNVLALLGSHQAVVRGAVADFLEAVVGPRLQQLLPAAAQ
ncbi:hypothetical protein PLESTF_000063300, partial [Pleodorina starrii]